MYVTFNPATDAFNGVCKFQKHEGVPTLAEMQEAVGGWIEAIDLFEDADGLVTLYCDEEFLYKGTQPTVYSDGFLYHPNGQILHGPFIIVRTTTMGDTVSLKESDLDRIVYGQKHIIHFGMGAMIPVMKIL